MVEKNYDPDNDNCPEKDTIENLHKSKLNNTQTAEEFIENSSNSITKDKAKNAAQKPESKQTEDN
jgi:chromosomal replication initiation ATPase DnaA